MDAVIEAADLRRRYRGFEAVRGIDLTVARGELSGGERRRLDLALALLGRPELLFLDEPTIGLDAQSRRDTWELIRQLKEQGTTVLLTTHYLEEAEQLADRPYLSAAAAKLGAENRHVAARVARERGWL